MRKTTSTTTEDDIRGITSDHRRTPKLPDEETISFLRLLRNRWDKGESPNQIAQEMGQPIKTIYGALKIIQQAIIEESRVGNHGKKNDI